MRTRWRILELMSDEDISKDTALILTEVRGVSAAVTSLTRHVDRMGERLGHVEQRLAHMERDLSEIKDDVKFIKGAVSEHSVDLDDHGRRIKRLESRTAH